MKDARHNLTMRVIVNAAQKLARHDRDQALDLLTTHKVPLHVAVRVIAGKTGNMNWSKAA